MKINRHDDSDRVTEAGNYARHRYYTFEFQHLKNNTLTLSGAHSTSSEKQKQ